MFGSKTTVFVIKNFLIVNIFHASIKKKKKKKKRKSFKDFGKTR